MKYCFALLILGVIHVAMAQDCGSYDPAWETCKTNSDCVLGEDTCNWAKAYNRNALDAATKFSRCTRPKVKCAPEMRPSRLGLIAICQSGKCGFRREQSTKAGEACANEGQRVRGRADGSMFLQGNAGEVETELVCQNGRWALAIAP